MYYLPTYLNARTHAHILRKLQIMHEVMYTQLLGTVCTSFALFISGIKELSHANVVSHCTKLSAWIQFLQGVHTTLPAKVHLRYNHITHRELKCYLEQDWFHFVLPLTHLPLLCEYFWLCSLRTQQIQRWMTPHLMQVWRHFRLLSETLCVLSACPPIFAVNDNANDNNNNNNNNNNCIAANKNNQ
jgi:hypothetical protein